MVESNPFFYRGPVRDAAYFFGRRQEAAYLFDLLRGGQSVAISGPRRFGKTSLLFYASTPDVLDKNGLEPACVGWINLDGGLLDGLEEEWLYGAIARELGDDVECAPYPRLLDRLQGLSGQGLRLIVALDEFELFAANVKFTPSTFNRLRGLAAHYPIQFVIASKDPVGSLSFANREALSSPFFNIFAPMRLSLLHETEAVEMLSTLSERGGQLFDSATIRWILDLVGPHPLFLQVAGYRAFAAQEAGALSPNARMLVQDQVLADLEAHFSYYWTALSAEEQYALAALPLSAYNGHSQAMNRLREGGLIYRHGYLGTAVHHFVAQQHVDGLLNTAGFVMDARRRLLSVKGQPIHLTPTEFAALQLFMQNPGQLLTPEDIEAALWPGEIAPDPERARGVVKKLRAALGDAGDAISNRRGQGYMLNLDWLPTA